jgi:hypothetical protein
MSERHEPRDLLDRAIDRAVRDLMSAEPSPQLTSAVLTRIAETADDSARSWWKVAAVAAAAVIILASGLTIWLGRPTDRIPATEKIAREAGPPSRLERFGEPRPPSPRPQPSRDLATSSGPTDDSAQDRRASASVPERRPASRAVEAAALAAPANALVQPIIIETLPAPRPIAIEPIVTGMSAIEGLGIPRMVITPLEVDEEQGTSPGPPRPQLAAH